jgi:hypothetical protein
MVNLPRDDLGVQRLREANTARTINPEVLPLTAGATVGSHSSPTPSVANAPPEERRRGERRQHQERRRQRQSTLLDTRAHYERRTQERRQQAMEQKGGQLGINVYI